MEGSTLNGCSKIDYFTIYLHTFQWKYWDSKYLKYDRLCQIKEGNITKI